MIESMGSKAIEKMVKALAAAWQRSAREHETELPECAFHCYVEHQRVPSPSLELYSGVQCILLPVSSEWHTALENKPGSLVHSLGHVSLIRWKFN